MNFIEYDNYAWIDQQEWAGDTPVLIHEMGHCLGLMHPNRTNCNQANPSGFCPNGTTSDYCTGDHVSDTPPTSSDITCDSLLGPNFMAVNTSTDDPFCRVEFTEEQGHRMRAYLRQTALLEGVQLGTDVFPDSSISFPSGDIIVTSGELLIDSPLEMLPGACIIVEKGATLRVKSTITGACGKMWKGILVRGSFSSSQSPSAQGQVVVQGNNALIENAECAIRQETATGGIIKVWGGTLKNNLKGIEFTSYASRSASQVLFANFTTTDAYLGENSPVYIDMFLNYGIDIRYSHFTDERSACPGVDNLAVGIISCNAGPQIGSNTFTGLYRGVNIIEFEEEFPATNCYNNTFSRCALGVRTSSSSNFMIRDNHFEVQVPFETCAPTEVFGAYLSDQTSGFLFTDNTFTYEGEEAPAYITTGTHCDGLGGGMANTIERNMYSHLSYGNRASDENADEFDGLLYLCNVNETFFELPTNDPTVLPAAIRVEPGGRILNPQAIRDLEGTPIFPTGNEFINTDAIAIENLGEEIAYYYFDDPQGYQDPTGTGFSPVGIGPNPEANELDEANPNCTDPEPCAPPCDEDDLAEAKDNFHQNKATWLEKKAAYPQITDEEEQEEALREIAGLRYHLNKDAKNILTHYRQDTLIYELDSVLHWLSLVKTYPADYRLARHHLFTGKFYSFDNLWPNLPEQYGLDSTRLAEYHGLDSVFATLRPYLQSGGALNQLPQGTTDSLLYWAGQCNEAGALARNVLLANGLRLEAECGSAPPSERLNSANTGEAAPAYSQEASAYPNPAREQLFLTLPESAGQGQAIFYNLQGNTVYRLSLSGGLNRLALPSAVFKPGIYLLKACLGDTAYQLKIAIY